MAIENDPCLEVLGIVSGGSPNGEVPVARGHSEADGENSMDQDPPLGGRLGPVEGVDREEQKRSEGAGWASSGAADGSSSADAAQGAGPDSASSAQQGVAAGSAGDDGSGAAGSAATGAAAGAIY